MGTNPTSIVPVVAVVVVAVVIVVVATAVANNKLRYHTTITHWSN
jgi:hypothetical protein